MPLRVRNLDEHINKCLRASGVDRVQMNILHRETTGVTGFVSRARLTAHGAKPDYEKCVIRSPLHQSQQRHIHS